VGGNRAACFHSPAHRAGTVGIVILRILELIGSLVVVGLIWQLCTKGFAWLWKYVPWLVTLWGLSGGCLLIVAYIFALRQLYWIGGIDLGVFLVIWFIASYTQSFDQV
jgi:hypothetical protein